MSLLHTQSCECLKSELDLFTILPTQVSIESSHYVQYKPLAALSDDAPIEFQIPGNSEEYIDLAHSLLYAKVTLEFSESSQKDDTKKGSLKHTGPVNNFLHSLFSQVDIYFNQKLVTQPNNHYPYRAYIENLLNYGSDPKNSFLTASCWFDDSAKNFDVIDSSSNSGLAARRNFFNRNNAIDMISRLHVDIASQNKLILNGIDMKVRLVRSRNSFALMDPAGDTKIKFNEISLMVRRVKINPEILVAHAKTLAQATAKYPFTRVELKSIVLQRGTMGESVDNIILGQLPKRIILGFVTNKAFNGDAKYNPFNFQHFYLNYLALYVDGKQIPSRALQPNYTDNHATYIEAFHTVFSGTGMHFLPDTHMIGRDDYPYGFCLYCFDLTPDLSANQVHWNLVKNGSVRMDVRFAHALEEIINCVIYAEFDSVLEIDQSRQCFIDYFG